MTDTALGESTEMGPGDSHPSELMSASIGGLRPSGWRSRAILVFAGVQNEALTVSRIGLESCSGELFIGQDSRTTLTPFHSLVGSVIAQKVSVKAADSITRNLHDHLDWRITAGRIVEAPEDELRSVGLSGAWTKTIKGLAHAINTGALDLEKALAYPQDSAVVAEVTKLWGIGRWTAEMFLMFTMHRLDMWPTEDLAMRKGWNIVHGAEGDIDPKTLKPLGDPLRPYRSVVAWYRWRAVEVGNSSW